MKLLPHEREIHGRWIYAEGAPKADSSCERIDVLIARVLVPVAATGDGWDRLYRDPADNRLWELTYLQSAMHGGGPPTLRQLSDEQAGDKYPTVR